MKSKHIYMALLVGLCLLYNCTPTTQAYGATKEQAEPPPVELQIIGPGEVQAGDLAIFHAQVPDDVDLDWQISPDSKGFYVDSNKRTALFASRTKGKYTLALAIATPEGKATCLIHVLQNGVGPDPDPDPDPDPNSKWQVMFFHESDDLDNYTKEQRRMLAGLTFRTELQGKGHMFLGAFDRDAVSKTFAENNQLSTWWKAVEGDPLPRVAVAPLEGGAIRDFDLPPTVAELYKLLGEK